jgi:hypothetical protein
LNDITRIFRKPAAIILLSGALMLVLISWYRAFMASTIMVDGHGLHGWPEALVFVVILLALGSFSFAYYRIWAKDGLELGHIKFLAFMLIGVFSFMLPMLSNDIFSYLVFGDAANKGADVYTNAQCTHFSTFFSYITGQWTSSTCAYGTVVLSMAMMATWVGAGKIAVALFIYKIMILLFAVVFIEVAARISVLMQSPVRCFAFIVLNPVFLMQGVGQLHADLIAITFILCAIYFLLKHKWYLAFGLVALSIATKMNYVLMLPFFVVAMALQNQTQAVMFRRVGSGLLIAFFTVGVVYIPFYTSAATVTTPFTFHFFQNPSKCIGEIIGDVIYFAPQLISGHSEQLQNTVTASSGPDRQLFISEVIVKICQFFALCSSLYILFNFMRGQRTMKRWFRVYVRLLLLFLLYYLHIFNPWYLMMFLPFMWFDENSEFMKWLFVLTCFISVQDVVCTISRDSIVYIVELGLTFISVMLYLYKPRRMFFTSLEDVLR